MREEEVINREAKGGTTLTIRPARAANELKATCERSIHAAPEQGRRGARKDNAQVDVGAGIFIPQRLHRVGPTFDVLNLVYDQKRAWTCRAYERPRLIPLLTNPVRGLAVFPHRTGQMWEVHPLKRLRNRSRLTCLTRTNENLEKPARLRHAPNEGCRRCFADACGPPIGNFE